MRLSTAITAVQAAASITHRLLNFFLFCGERGGRAQLLDRLHAPVFPSCCSGSYTFPSTIIFSSLLILGIIYTARGHVDTGRGQQTLCCAASILQTAPALLLSRVAFMLRVSSERARWHPSPLLPPMPSGRRHRHFITVSMRGADD